MQDSPGEYKFIHANDNKRLANAKELFIEYTASLDFDLSFQNFREELSELNSMYQKPYGGIILIKEMETGNFIGCAGIRRFENQIAEIKRMYIKREHRNKGLGARLLDLAIELAKELGYKKIRLDTVESMKPAIKIYRSRGFKQIEPYRFNPNENTFYFELNC